MFAIVDKEVVSFGITSFGLESGHYLRSFFRWTLFFNEYLSTRAEFFKGNEMLPFAGHVM